VVTETFLAEILARLDLVVFERLPDGVFLRVGSAQPPAWFTRLFLDAAGGEPITLSEAFPFLAEFIVEAENSWSQGRELRLRSDPFVMPDPSGGEIGLIASAVAAGHRRLLVLELSGEFDERRALLQRAREHALAHEDHVRRTGALQTQVDAAQRLAGQLAASGLSAEQQRLAAGLRDQLASLSESLDALAPLPKGVSRRQPR
jgi:hypothetical protein